MIGVELAYYNVLGPSCLKRESFIPRASMVQNDIVPFTVVKTGNLCPGTYTVQVRALTEPADTSATIDIDGTLSITTIRR
jgi:hypothetical protein